MNWYKKAQITTDYLDQTKTQTAGPNVIIAPYEPLIQQAVDELKTENPNIFNGVNQIVLDNAQNALGYVSNINEQEQRYDFNNIHINLQQIKNELQNKSGIPINANNEQHKRALIMAIKEVIVHEKAHVGDASMNEETGEVIFPGGEGVAENATRQYLGV